MKKIFTLIAVALCAMGVNAQNTDYTLATEATVIDQVLIDGLAAQGTSATINIPEGMTVDVNGISDSGEKTAIKIPDGFSVTFVGIGETKPTLNFPKALDISGTHEYVRFDNVAIKDGGCQYFINQSGEANVAEFTMANSTVSDFERSFIRTQGEKNISIGNITVDNCIFTNIASGNGYSVFYFGTATTVIGKLELKKSTFNTSQRSFIEASKQDITNGVFITDCTLYNNVAEGRYLMDAKDRNTNLTVTNTIFGKTYSEKAKGVRTKGTMTFTNCIRTADCTFASNDVADLVADERSSETIFTDPANADFTLKIADKVGDPRWYGAGGSDAINNINKDNNFVETQVYNLAGQKVNDAFKGVVVKNGKKLIQK